MNLETFKERFNELSLDSRIAIYNWYHSEHGDPDRQINSFDEEFFQTYLPDSMEAVRAAFFGNIQSWADEYIRFNAYGNLESLNRYTAEDEISCYIDDIFEHPDIWGCFIDDDEDDEDKAED